MGFLLKGLAVLVGLTLIPLGLALVSAVLFLYAFSGVLGAALGRKRTKVVIQNSPAVPPVRFKGYSGHPLRWLVGLAFVGLSVIALASGGIFSPFFFGGIGALFLLWGAPVKLGGFGSLRPVEESVVMRRGLDPIHWFAMAEVKLATRQPGRALGGIDETLLIDLAGQGPSVFVLLRTTAVTHASAEESLLERFRKLACVSAPLGAYIMPLDSKEVSLRQVEPIELEARGWPSPLSTLDYDLLVVDSKRGGFVHGMGAYKINQGKGETNPTSLSARQALSRPVLLWEVFQELGKRTEWQKPDGYTAFLASMFATEGETMGERIFQSGEGSGSQLLVQSVGTPPVKMSRAQLRAIARVYS